MIINKPIRLIELFSGIGFQNMALRDIGANFENWKTCEWDVNAIKQYKAIHCPDDNINYSQGKSKEDLIQFFLSKGISIDGKKPLEENKLKRKSEQWLRKVYNDCCATNNLIDISTIKGSDLQIVDTDKYCYIMTYSFPCTNLSIAGKMNGMEEGSGTASSLLWEVKRILSETEELPQILLMENVIGVHSNKNLPHFEEWISFLESLGYSNFWQDMNAKDYGMAQSRNRTFMISILDPNHEASFTFPKTIELTKEMIDYLENETLDRFYINTPQAKELIERLIEKDKEIAERRTIDLSIINPKFTTTANCITAHLAKEGNGIQNRQAINNGVLELTKPSNSGIKFVDNISPVKNRENPNQGRVYMTDGICPTLTAMEGGNRQPHIVEQQKDFSNYRIRKITPLEAFRLMGASDEDYNKAKEVASYTAMYKAAGNGIVKNCLEAIFCSMNIKNVPSWEDYSKKYII